MAAKYWRRQCPKDQKMGNKQQKVEAKPKPVFVKIIGEGTGVAKFLWFREHDINVNDVNLILRQSVKSDIPVVVKWVLNGVEYDLNMFTEFNAALQICREWNIKIMEVKVYKPNTDVINKEIYSVTNQ